VWANLVCFFRQGAFRVIGQQAGQDEQIVQRRPQLVRHIGQELRLVLGGERQLRGFVLQVLPGLLHFGVLPLHFRLLVESNFAFSCSSPFFSRSSSCCLLSMSSEVCNVAACCSSRVLVPVRSFLSALQFGSQRLRLVQESFRSAWWRR